MSAARTSIVAAFVCAAAIAQTPLEWPSRTVAGQLGGPTIAVASAGNVVLAGSGYQVVVYDASDPNALREIGSASPFRDFVRNIAIASGRAYVAAGSSGLQILDLSDPRSPSVIGSWDSPGSAEGVAVVGTTAYLADGPFGLRVIDVSNASSPQPIGVAFEEAFAFDVAVSGSTAVIAAAGAGLLIADVSNPRMPVERGGVDTPGYARGVAVTGGHAVVADQWEGIRVIDIGKAIEVASLPTDSWAFDVVLAGSTAFVATGSAGVVSIDVSDPASPREAGKLALAGADSVAVAVTGNRAFVAAGRGGLQVVDVTNTASPQLVEVLPGLGDGLSVAAAPPYVYVASQGGFAAVDVTNPSRPRQLGVFGAGGAEYGTYVAVAGPYAYLGGSGQLVTFDVSNPAHPVETSRTDLGPAAFRHITVRERLLLAATEWELAIFEINDPARPLLRARLPMYRGPGTQQAVGVATNGRYAFVAQDKAGMTVVDLLDPAAPVVIGHYGANPLCGLASIAASNDYVYVPQCGQLDVVDVADPASPRSIGFLPLKCCAYRATLAGKMLYLAMPSEGVFEIDVSNPSAPRIVSRTVLSGRPQEVAVSDAWLAVSVTKLGLFLLQGASGTTVSSRKSDSSSGQRASSPPPPPAARAEARDAGPSGGRQVVVDSAADSGPGTLRQAIDNAVAGDVITFDAGLFPPGAPVRIRPLSALGCVQANITLDASNAGVVLDGSMIPETSRTVGLSLCSSGSSLRGLQIMNFPGSGIAVGGSANTIGGDRRRGAGPVGEGLLISGNRDGIDFGSSARQNRVVGSVIGAMPAGFTLRFQQSPGIFFAHASENVVGGTSEAEANVISGNQIDVNFNRGSYNRVIGNYIGTDITGTRVAPTQLAGNSEIGVNLEGGSHDNLIADNVIASGQAVCIADSGSHYNRIIRNRVGITRDGKRIEAEGALLSSGIGIGESYNLAAENTIGGLSHAAIHTTALYDVFILGNFVGTDAEGAAANPNGAVAGGILLQNARRAFIGGTSPSERNVISRNLSAGVELRGPGNEQNFILGNRIAANGRAGILASDSHKNFIQRNTLTGNRVGIDSTEGSANRIRRNAIFDNQNAGIQHSTANSPAAPVIFDVRTDTVSGAACAGCVVELFSDSDREGAWFEGETVAGADGSFTVRASSFLRGPRVSATATDPNGSTSTFSTSVETPPLPPRRRAVRPQGRG